MQSIKEQAFVVSRAYRTFAFRDENLFHLPSSETPSLAALLNKYGNKPDFTAKSLARGWLAPNGDFIGCELGFHADLLSYTLGLSSEQAKKEGWVAIHPNDIWQTGSMPLTAEQEASLLKLGFSDGKRETVLDYDDSYEPVRKLYAGDKTGTYPTFIDPARAATILENVPEALRQLEQREVHLICSTTRSLFSGKDWGRIDDYQRRINDVLQRTLDRYNKLQLAIK